MLMTEERARKKWCPMKRLFVTADFAAGAAVNFEHDAVPSDGTCIASQCMMWRFGGALVKGEGTEHLGYCGLAGNPRPADD